MIIQDNSDAVLIVLFLTDEGELTCEQLTREQLYLRFRDRQGGQMDYCLSDKVNILKRIPEKWRAHDIVILRRSDAEGKK